MKHKNAEVVKAFVDGIECEYWSEGYRNWIQITELNELELDKVRIKPEPPKEKEQEPQYLYIYRDTSNNISVYHAMMVEKFNHFYYLGKVRVEK